MREMTKCFNCCLLFFLLFISAHIHAMQAKSSTIRDDICLKIDENEYTGATQHRCEGVGGYKLLVLYDDNRMSVNVITPTKKQYPLDLWSAVTTSFSSLDNAVEWRVPDTNKPEVPVAMILKVSSAGADVGMSRKSWWVVIKLGTDNICITNIIESGTSDIKLVRQLADNSHSLTCL